LEMLRQGSIEARATAAATLDEVKAAMRINYFEDDAWVKEQSAKYSAGDAQ